MSVIRIKLIVFFFCGIFSMLCTFFLKTRIDSIGRAYRKRTNGNKVNYVIVVPWLARLYVEIIYKL